MDYMNFFPRLMLPLVLIFYVAPLAAAIWALVTLQQIRAAQHAVQAKLDAIERLLQRA